jgi:hypothetical protein
VHFLEETPATMPSKRYSAAQPMVTSMNLRNATRMERQRKNIQFEQERIASLDYDIQRAGGITKKSPHKKPKGGSKNHKSADK